MNGTEGRELKMERSMREENALETYVRQVKPLDREAAGRAREHWSHVAHPLHSLGLLEDAIVKIAGMTEMPGFTWERRRY